MELSHEDVMRLHVLLAHARAVRIDESRMCVHGLTETGEVKVPLHPTGHPDIYLRLVREMLSTQVLGSPRGYPVYLRRWARMGQMQVGRLEPLLLLGEPEAVTAVACSPALTPELAEKAWWALPTSETARYLLRHPAVRGSGLGRTLAAHLLEHLPFEQETPAIIETIRLILQPGLLEEGEKRSLWEKGRRRSAYQVGFLLAIPRGLPEDLPPHPLLASLAPRLSPLGDNPYAEALQGLLSGQGQAFLKAVERVFHKPADQDVVVALLEAVRAYLAPVNPEGLYPSDPGALLPQAEAGLSTQGVPPGLEALSAACPEARAQIRAMLVLAQAGEPLVRPIFAKTTAVGTLMRRKIEPVAAPLLEHLRLLRA